MKRSHIGHFRTWKGGCIGQFGLGKGRIGQSRSSIDHWKVSVWSVWCSAELKEVTSISHDTVGARSIIGNGHIGQFGARLNLKRVISISPGN
jgi:hypothetical protein